jgi:MGT family glycosyltransferase
MIVMDFGGPIMPNIGLVTPAYTGHVNTMSTLARELQRRGHQVTLISTPDAEAKALRSGLPFAAIGESEFPIGYVDRFTEQQGVLSGASATRFIIGDLVKLAGMQLRDLPPLLARSGIDALVVDQIVPAANIVAERYNVPFVNVCSFMPLNSEPGIPPVMTTWPYSTSVSARVRNAIGYRVVDLTMRPLVSLINTQRAEWGMAPVPVNEVFSNLAQVAQQPAFFDFPRKQLPACFHYTGPFHDTHSGDPVPFPWDRLDGRPLIYASMGTLQNRIAGVFHTIAEACVGLGAQLVLSLGRKDADTTLSLPGNPLVVGYAPQLDLLRKASVVITHGGTNTVLESLAQGVPMVALPVATDQLGVSARVKYLNVGKFIPIRKVKAHNLRAAVDRVRSEPAYRDNARKYQRIIAELDGLGSAADIIERAFRTGRPVLAPPV